jgi:trans-aconitate methyltransferase
MTTSQTWDPERYARTARFVAELGVPVLELLDPRRGERVLDLGCGDGHLTTRLVEAGCTVVGIDSSPAQVEAAQRVGLDARVMAAEELSFEDEFDAVFSNATLHWVTQADTAISSVWRALKNGGRFVGEFGGEGCVARIREALGQSLERRGIEARALDPWYFPSAAEYRGKLERGGFRIESIAVFPRPTVLPGDLKEWLETFAQAFTSVLDPQERPAFVAEVQDALQPYLCDSTGRWTADYTRLRFRAHKHSRLDPHSIPYGVSAGLE